MTEEKRVIFCYYLDVNGFALQEKSFQSAMRPITDDIRGELRVIRKELQDHKESVSFISNKYDDLTVSKTNKSAWKPSETKQD